MNRKHALLASLSALVTLSIFAIASAQTKPSDAASDKPAAGEKVENPSYKAWMNYKPGTSVTMKGSTTAQGQDVELDVTTKLVSLDDEKAVLEVATVAKANGMEMPQPAQKMEVPKSVSKSDLEKPGKGFDPSLLANAKEEKVTVAAGTFNAKMIEFNKTQQGMTRSVKSWFSEEVPGGTVKQEVSGEGNQNGQEMKFQMKMELSSIDKK